MSKVVTSPTVSQIGSSLRPQNAAAPCFRLNAAAMLKPKKLCPQEPWSNCACLTCQLAESAVEESAVKESAPASSPASSPAISTCSLLEESAVEESAVEEAVEELPVEESAVEESALERSRRVALLEFRKRLQPIEAARARRRVPGTASHMSSSSTHEAPPQVCSEEAPWAWAMWMTERTAAMAIAARVAAARLDEEERQRAQAARDEAFALKAKVEADLEAKQVALQEAELAPGVHALEAELALRECNEESGLETPSPSAENALPGWSYEEVEVVRDVEVRSREAEKKHTVEVRRHGGRGRKRPWRSHTHDPDDSV